MSLLPPFVGGLLVHLLWRWVGVGEAWISLLIVVWVACLLVSAASLAQVTAWSWLRGALQGSAKLVDAVARLLPGGGGGGAKGGWDDAAPALAVAAAAGGFAVVQFVDEMAEGDVVGRIVLLAVGLVLLGLELAAGAWEMGEDARGGGGGGERGSLSASVPLPAALGGGGDRGGRLKFVLDV